MRLKVPSLFAATDVTSVVPAYKLTVTGLPARTCPATEPSGRAVGVGDSAGVEVAGAVGVSTGVEEVGVAVSTGVREVGVAVSTGVKEVGVAVSTGVREVGVAVSTGVKDVGVAVSTGVKEVGVAVSAGVDEVGVAVSTGVKEVGVGDSTGVGVSKGVGVKVAVGKLPTTVRLVPVDERLVSTLSPLETRTVQVIALCPACRPVAVKVNAVPLVVALLPLLPAIATMKLPFCGSLIAIAASAPKRLVTAIFPT